MELKAYVVREDSEGNCAIAFATNSAAARREGAGELNMEFEEVESCRREPAFDKYAPGPVPLHATLAAGWWHECMHCGTQFDEDGRRGYDDDDREDDYEPVQDARQNNYCSPTCMMKEWAERRAAKAAECAMIEACEAKWPEATRIKPYRRRIHGEGTAWAVSFGLFGLMRHVDWIIGEPVVYVAQADADEFRRRYGSEDSAGHDPLKQGGV